MDALTLFKIIPPDIAACVIGDNFKIENANHGFFALTGYSEKEFAARTGGNILSLIDADDAQNILSACCRGAKGSAKLHFVGKNGERICVAMRALPVSDDESTLTVLIMFDMTDAKGDSSQAEKLNDTAVPLRAFLCDMDVCVTLVEVDGSEFYPFYMSPSFFERLNCTKADEQIFYKDPIININKEDIITLKEAICAAAYDGGTFDVTYRSNTKTGETRYTHMRGRRISESAQGNPVIIAFLSDVTELTGIKQELKLSQERLNLAFSQTSAVIWEYDVKSRVMHTSDVGVTLYGNYGATIENVPECLILNRSVHPESASALYDFFQKIELGENSGVTAVRVRKADRGYSWARLSFISQYDSFGRAYKAVGILEELSNITEMKQSFDEELKLMESLSGQLLFMWIANLTHDNVERVFNSSDVTLSEQNLPLSYSRMLNLGMDLMTGDVDLRSIRDRMSVAALKKEFEQGDSYLCVEVEKFNHGGRTVFADVLIRLVQEPVSGDLYAFFFVRDTDEKNRISMESGIVPEFDIASNLYASRTTFEYAKYYTEMNAHADGECALVLMSIDNFADIRDLSGLRIAANVLFAVGRLYGLCFPTKFVRGIIGDGVVAMFVPEVSGDANAHDLSEKVLRLMRSSLVRTVYHDPLICSVGAATMARDGANYIDLFAQAEASLAAAKKKGGGAYAIFDPDSPYEKADRSFYSELIETDALRVEATDQGSVKLLNASEKSMATSLMECTAKLISSDDTTDSINTVLNALIDFYKASRCNVFEVGDGGGFMSNTYEVCGEGIQPQSEFLKYVPLINDTVFDRVLREQKTVSLDVINSSELDLATELEHMSISGITSQMVTPIINFDVVRAFVSVENPTRFADECAFLEAASYLISGEIVKRRTTEYNNYLSKHDSMTGALNRESYFDKLQASPDRDISCMGVLCVDVADIAELNHEFGREYCDDVIIALYETLTKTFDSSDVYRYFAAQFIVTAEDMPDGRFFKKVKNVIDKLEAKYKNTLVFGYSWTDKDVDIDMMEAHCEEMMRMAREDVAKNFRKMSHKSSLLDDLLVSLQQGQFHMFLQPVYDLKTGKIAGAEALARVEHPEQGLVYPKNFIPLLEREDLTQYLDLFIAEQVMKTLERWKKEGRSLIPISMNFSRATFKEKELVHKLVDMQSNYTVGRNLLEFEMTETEDGIEEEGVSSIAKDMINAGYRLALDCFGARFSGFNVLSEIPFSVLKLDRSIISNIVNDERYRAVAESAIALCGRLGIESVAKGVEREDQLRILRKMGCESAMGYYFNKPMPISEFEKL